MRGDAPSPNNSKKVLGGPVESSTVGVAAATSNTVGCSAGHPLHGQESYDLKQMEGELTQLDLSTGDKRIPLHFIRSAT